MAANTSKKFKVVGNHPVAGVAPGGQVDLSHLPDANIAALIDAGHVRPVKRHIRKQED